MNEFSFLILKLILAASASLITGYLVPVLKEYLDQMRNQKLAKAIQDAVKAAEQTFKGSGQGTAKKEDVLKSITEWLEEKGIRITDKQLDQLIESAVYALNHPESK